MFEKRIEIKDSQVKDNLRWHILRLLRLKSRSREELIDKLNDIYLGYWPVNSTLIDVKKIMNPSMPNWKETAW